MNIIYKSWLIQIRDHAKQPKLIWDARFLPLGNIKLKGTSTASLESVFLSIKQQIDTLSN